MPIPRAETWTVAAGATRVIPMASDDRLPPVTVNAVPTAGGSALVEYTLTPSAIDNPAAATWIAWPPSSVTSAAVDTLDAAVVALRLSAQVQPAVFNMVSTQ